jgi:hypothetical protein
MLVLIFCDSTDKGGEVPIVRSRSMTYRLKRVFPSVEKMKAASPNASFSELSRPVFVTHFPL